MHIIEIEECFASPLCATDLFNKLVLPETYQNTKAPIKLMLEPPIEVGSICKMGIAIMGQRFAYSLKIVGFDRNSRFVFQDEKGEIVIVSGSMAVADCLNGSIGVFNLSLQLSNSLFFAHKPIEIASRALVPALIKDIAENCQ